MENKSDKSPPRNVFSINHEKFMTDNGIEILRKKQTSKKYNIKIKKSDLILLDAMAETNEVPRSALLNNILHNILLNSLKEEVKDEDTKILIASEADNLVNYDHTVWPWIFDVLPNKSKSVIDNVEKYNSAVIDFPAHDYPSDTNFNSDSYNSVKKALKEYKNEK